MSTIKRDRKAENPEKYKTFQKDVRERTWAKRGINVEEARNLRETQKRCEICGATECKLNIDHDHYSNNIRGVLCNRCNLCLGLFEDKPGLLRYAADYLDYHAGIAYN